MVKGHPFYNTPLKEKAMWLEMQLPYKPRKNRKNFYIIFFHDPIVVEKNKELKTYREFKEFYIEYVKKTYNITYTSNSYDYFKIGRTNRKRKY